MTTALELEDSFIFIKSVRRAEKSYANAKRLVEREGIEEAQQVVALAYCEAVAKSVQPPPEYDPTAWWVLYLARRLNDEARSRYGDPKRSVGKWANGASVEFLLEVSGGEWAPPGGLEPDAWVIGMETLQERAAAWHARDKAREARRRYLARQRGEDVPLRTSGGSLQRLTDEERLERQRQYARTWAQAHKDEINARRRARYLAHRDEEVARMRARRATARDARS